MEQYDSGDEKIAYERDDYIDSDIWEQEDSNKEFSYERDDYIDSDIWKQEDSNQSIVGDLETFPVVPTNALFASSASIVDDLHFLYGLKKLQKIDAFSEDHPVIKKEKKDFLGSRTIKGKRYQLEKSAFNKTSGALCGYYKCCTVQSTWCKARFIDKGEGTIYLNGIEHVCNQDYKSWYTALELAAYSSLNSDERSKLKLEQIRKKTERTKKRKLDERNDAQHARENEGLREKLATIAAAKLAVKSANQVLAAAKLAAKSVK
jgi:hypothetical protein